MDDLSSIHDEDQSSEKQLQIEYRQIPNYEPSVTKSDVQSAVNISDKNRLANSLTDRIQTSIMHKK